MGNTPNVIAGTGLSVDSGSSSAVDELEPSITPVEGGPESPALETPEPEGGAELQPETGAEGAVEGQREDGRLIPKWIRDLKEANPEGYKAAKADFFTHREYKSIFPTVQEARETKDLLQSLGGQQGISSLREDSGFFREIRGQFQKGDPAFVQDLWKDDPIAAALHVSPMLEQYKAMDNEGYKSTIARIWSNDFKSLNFAPALRDLAAAIKSGDKAAAAEIAQSIQQWHDNINDVASRAEDPRVKTLLAERNKQLETRQQTEQQEFIKGYRTDALNGMVAEAGKVFDSFFRGRKLDAEDRTDLLREAIKFADQKVGADKAYKEQVQQHLDKGDKASAVKLTKARYAQEMTDAVKRIARRYGLVSGAAKPAPQQTPGNGQPKPQVAAGFVAVKERPTPETINRRATTPEMIISGKAILNDGRKVDWSALKRT